MPFLVQYWAEKIQWTMMMLSLSHSVRTAPSRSHWGPLMCWRHRAVAAVDQGAPGQMLWLEDPPPWLHLAYCFASVIVWAIGGAYSAPQTPYLDFRGPTSKGSEGRGRGEKGKKGKGKGGRPLHPLRNSLRHWVRRALRSVRDSGWPDLAWWFSDLEMTWLLYCAGAATGIEGSSSLPLNKHPWRESTTGSIYCCNYCYSLAISTRPAV